MRIEVIPGSRDQPHWQQQITLKEKKGYVVPDLLSATVGILTHFVRRGERLFSDAPWTYIFCNQTPAYGWRTIVGGFHTSGLSLRVGPSVGHNTIGVAPMRKFS